MALQNDDWDIYKSWFRTEYGGNGDYYLQIAQETNEKMSDGSNLIKTNSLRFTTSGNRYPTEVLLAIANLHKVLEKYELNDRILNKELEFKYL